MTQEALCEGAWLSLDSVSRIENGTRVPTLDIVQKLAGGLGVSGRIDHPRCDRATDEVSPTTLRFARRLERHPELVWLTAEKLLDVFLSYSKDGQKTPILQRPQRRC